MPLDKSTLGSTIADAFAASHGQGLQDSDTTIANAIADAIDIYVKGGLVSTTVVTPDTFAGTGTGAVT